MADRFYSGSYSYKHDPYPSNYSSHRGLQSQYTKPVNERNNVDFKQSNISQQTIIHKARLYSPDKNHQFIRRNFNNSQAYDKTKARKTEITAKIHQIVDLCEDEEDAQIHQFKEVIQAQKKILNMLHQKNHVQQPNLNINLSNVGQDRGTTFGPIRNQSFPIKNQSKPANQKNTTNVNSVRQTITRDNIYKKSAIDDLKTDRNAQQPEQPYLQGQFVYRNSETNKRPFQKPFPINDQTQKMIEQIERKAMQQIQSLRTDKIELMRKLNEQIRLHNQQKKLRMRLQNQLARIKGQPIPHRQIAQQANYMSEPVNNNKNQQKRHQTQTNIHQNQHQGPIQTYHPPYQHTQPQNYATQPNYRNQQLPAHQNQQQPQYPRQYHSQSQPQHAYQVQPRQVPYQSNRNEDLSVYEQQIERLQAQNNNLIKTLRAGGERNAQKQQLRSQVGRLNQLIAQYQFELQKFRHQKSDNSYELEQLLRQGQRIQQDTWRLLRKQEQPNQSSGLNIQQRLFRNETSRNELIQDANNFKKRLIQYGDQNTRSNKNIRFGSRKDITDDYRASLPNLNSNYNIGQDDKLSEFQRILGDLKNAVR